MSDRDSEIVDAEIVEVGDDEIEPRADADAATIHDAEIVDDAAIDDADVVSDGNGVVTVAEPEVITPRRDPSGPVPIPLVAEPPPDPAPSAIVMDPAPGEQEPIVAVPPPPDDLSTLSYPRLSARTQRFTLGEPRTVTVSADGERIMFLRSRGPVDAVNCLWTVDAASGDERLVADPHQLLADGDDDELPPEERARRERTREQAGGVTAYATDATSSLAAFVLAGRLFVTDLDTGHASELHVAGPVFDPRPDPTGQRVAYVSGQRLCVASLDGMWRVVAGGDTRDPDPATVSWGSAEFVAAEEMNRYRGFWWSPDGTALAAARVDTGPVQQWHFSDPGDPAVAGHVLRYPSAGTPNADVSLHVINLATNRVADVEWDRAAFPYLTDVAWSRHGLLVSVQSRDQRNVEVRDADPVTGETRVVFADTDASWVELVGGVPRHWARGNGAVAQVIACADRDGARRLLVDGQPVTPDGLQVRSVASADEGGIVFLANPTDDATVVHVWRYTVDGRLEALTDEPGIHAVAAAGATVVVRTATLGEPRTYWDTLDGVELASHAAEPNVRLNVSFAHLGPRRLATAVILPADHDGGALPVLVDPYGGPHALRAVRSHHAHASSQWFADQGFAVVVTDGRGTPGRGSEWERAVHLDLIGGVLEDQVDALEQAAAEHPWLDLDRVGIRGWSFGGYLAAAAVLLRPDRFHAAVAGAPVTEWRLYDTHYTERYLGDPAAQPDVYDGSSLLPLAKDLRRPLLLIHGLADDNVVAAHTLRLSSALLAHGRPHEVLPLVGVTHMTPQEVVSENLQLHQLEFLRRALAAPSR